VHQPIYVLTQFLIARGLQRPIAVVSIVTTLANLALSFVLAWRVGIWGVALSTLVTDVLMLAWMVPRFAAPASGSGSWRLIAAMVRPAAPALVAAAVVLVGLARWWSPQTLAALAVVGVAWVVVGGFALWRFGLAESERAQFQQHFLRFRPAASTG
jgi:O-antigen/teichoic acid export membrane protein